MGSISDARHRFEWSLAPIVTCIKFVGVRIDAIKRSSLAIRALILALGCLILLMNVTINSARTTDVTRFYDADKIDTLCQGLGLCSWAYTSRERFALVSFATGILDLILFFAVPLTHLVFLVTTLTTRFWVDLWSILKLIQQEMKLTKGFYESSRRHCIFALVLILLVIDQVGIDLGWY
jgi:hypothetical protein